MRSIHAGLACRRSIPALLVAATALCATACTNSPGSARADGAAALAAAPGADAAPTPSDGYLVPLTRDDVRLYLDVMRAAAARVRHPTADDMAALQLEQSSMEKMRRNVPEQITQAEIDAEDRTTALHGHVDELIAAERHLDADHYAHIVDRVEDVVVPPPFDVDGQGDRSTTPYVPTPHARAVDAARAVNRKLLAPWRDEIRALETVVRPS